MVHRTMNRYAGALALVAVVVGGLALGFAQLRIQGIVDEQRRDDQQAVAQQCVDAWELRTGSHEAIALAIHGIVQTFVVVFPNARPETIASVRDAATAQIEQAQAEIPLPDCDLADARAVLDNH